MTEGNSRHIKKFRESYERRGGPFKSESYKRCESHTTQLSWKIKSVRNLCLKCLDFTEKGDSLVQTEIFFAKTVMCL